MKNVMDTCIMLGARSTFNSPSQNPLFFQTPGNLRSIKNSIFYFYY